MYIRSLRKKNGKRVNRKLYFLVSYTPIYYDVYSYQVNKKISGLDTNMFSNDPSEY